MLSHTSKRTGIKLGKHLNPTARLQPPTTKMEEHLVRQINSKCITTQAFFCNAVDLVSSTRAQAFHVTISHFFHSHSSHQWYLARFFQQPNCLQLKVAIFSTCVYLICQINCIAFVGGRLPSSALTWSNPSCFLSTVAGMCVGQIQAGVEAFVEPSISEVLGQNSNSMRSKDFSYYTQVQVIPMQSLRIY